MEDHGAQRKIGGWPHSPNLSSNALAFHHHRLEPLHDSHEDLSSLFFGQQLNQPSHLLFCVHGALLCTGCAVLFFSGLVTRQLAGNHCGVAALTVLDQLLMTALFDHFALVQDYDAVGVLDGAEAVGNDHDRASALHLPHETVQRLLHLSFVLCVQRRGGFIEKEKTRAPDQRPSNAEALPLATAEVVPTFADHRVVPFRQWPNELLGVGQRRCLFDIRGTERARAKAIGDVLKHCSSEELRVLRHYADVSAQCSQVQVPQVRRVQGNTAGCWIVEAQQQLADGGLAAAALAHNRCGLACRDGEAHTIQHLLVRPALVVELYVAKAQLHLLC
mmetsp:Transcript_3001/g.7002  ORF Transcript_3001/g.7002 Transcript_3001/m.7002 type:complete len:332 (-) Transcript_3001:146-1141(-)